MPGGTPYDGLYGEAPPKIKGVPFSMLLDVVACCCPKFETGQTFQPTTPNISFVPWSPKRLHSSSNIVGATHVHYAWFTKTYWLYPSHDALQVPTLLGVVASVCIPLPTRTLLRPFARSLRMSRFWIKVTHTDKAEDKKQAEKYNITQLCT